MRYVVAVAEERSFTRAAERCRVVQSALSHQIKALERELGVTLFARTSRRVELTAAGEAFLPAARASLAAADRAKADAAAALGEVRGSLAIGLIPTVTAVDVPGALAAFHREHPAVTISLRGGGSDSFVEEIASGRMDVAVLGFPDAVPVERVATRTLARERLVAVVPEGHPLAGRDGVRLADLAEQRFADFPADTPGRAQSDRAFELAGVRREVAFEAMDVALLLELVRSGLVITLMARGLLAGKSGVRAVELVDGPTRIEYLAWSAFNPSPAALAFLGFVGFVGAGEAGPAGSLT